MEPKLSGHCPVIQFKVKGFYCYCHIRGPFTNGEEEDNTALRQRRWLCPSINKSLIFAVGCLSRCVKSNKQKGESIKSRSFPVRATKVCFCCFLVLTSDANISRGKPLHFCYEVCLIIMQVNINTAGPLSILMTGFSY